MSIFKITRSRKATVNQTNKYYKTNKSITLVAPMQSGKTSTYFDVAIDAIKNGIVKKIVIFSGNRETMLRKQTMDSVSKNELLKDVTEVVWHRSPSIANYNRERSPLESRDRRTNLGSFITTARTLLSLRLCSGNKTDLDHFPARVFLYFQENRI